MWRYQDSNLSVVSRFMLLDLKLKPRLVKRWIKHCYPLGGLQNRRYFWRFQAGEGKREARVERARGTRNGGRQEKNKQTGL